MAGAVVEEEEVIKISAKDIITIKAEAINKASITLKTNRVTIKDTTKVIVSIAKVKNQQSYPQNYPYQNGNYYGRGQPRSGYQNTGIRNPTNNTRNSGQQSYSEKFDQILKSHFGDSEQCFRCHKRHPPNQCFAVDATNGDELSADLYAFQLLNHPPNEEVFQAVRAQEDCNLVDASPSSGQTGSRARRRRRTARQLSTTDFVTLTLLCVLGLMRMTVANDDSKPSFNAWQPMNPMICGSDYTDAPQLFKIRDHYQCMSNDTSNSTMMPQKDFEIEVYKKNMLQTMDTAYQCKKNSHTT